MSFANLKSNSMDINKLVTAAQEASGATTKTNKYEDERKWKPTVDDTVMVTQSFVSYLPWKVKTCHGYVIGITDSRALKVNGISRNR